MSSLHHESVGDWEFQHIESVVGRAILIGMESAEDDEKPLYHDHHRLCWSDEYHRLNEDLSLAN